MMRYLEYDFLKSKKLQHFDNWISVFGEQKSYWELAPAGNNVNVKNGQVKFQKIISFYSCCGNALVFILQGHFFCP